MTRELVWTGFTTADGVMDSPGGDAEGHPSGGWVFRTPFDANAFSLKSDELEETTGLMFGRRSYETFAPVWPGSADHIDYKELPKYVVSTTLDDSALIDGWGDIRILRSADEVAALKETPGGAIFIHGSGELARRLAEADLIDRYNILMFPVLLGAGKSVFNRAHHADQRLALRESASYDNGVIKLVYEVVR